MRGRGVRKTVRDQGKIWGGRVERGTQDRRGGEGCVRQYETKVRFGIGEGERGTQDSTRPR